MNTDQKVTSLELSKQLKEAGAKQESEHTHYILESDLGVRRGGTNQAIDSVALFNCAELLERLPGSLSLPDGVGSLQARKTPAGKYWVGYYDADGTGMSIRLSLHPFDTPAEALGKLYLFCLKEGHVTE